MRSFAKILKETAMDGINKAVGDGILLQIIQSELRHELSNDRFKVCPPGSLGEFVLESDIPNSKDVVLRRECGSRENVAVSAVLGPIQACDGPLPREVLAKVCLVKTGMNSVLQFDCKAFCESGISDFKIYNIICHDKPSFLTASNYGRGTLFRSLDPRLQKGLKAFLVEKGFHNSLSDFLLLHLHKKEQDQYVKWLQKLEAFLSAKTD